jgi:hypothetical protein
MKHLRALGAVLLLSAACAGTPASAPTPPQAVEKKPPEWRTIERNGVMVHYQAVDATVAEMLLGMTLDGRRHVESFFGASFPARFEVLVFPDRAGLTDHWRKAWGLAELETQCWMVASGTRDELTILSPRVWASEACEHDAGDAARTAALVTHELVHVFHEQHLPAPGFDGMDDVAWFVEGLAVHVSGQLALGHMAPASEAVAAGKAPEKLAAAWSGKYKYGVCGSIVAFVDTKVGRALLLELLTLRSEAELLAAIGLSEAELLAAWKQSIAR